MKKVMFAAALMAAGVAMAVDSNIVGYQQISIPQGTWQLYAPTFKGVTTTLKLSDIKVCNASGVEFDDNNKAGGSGRCRGGAVKVYKMNTSSGTLSDSMGYTSAGYADRETTRKESWGWAANRNETISEGEGLIVRNGHTTDVKFQVSGEVILAPVVAVSQGTWGIIGNDTPRDRVLGDFKVCNASGVEFDDNNKAGGSGRCRGGAVKVYKMNTSSGTLSDSMGYTSAGYADRETTRKESWGWAANRNEPVAAGEALVIRNGHTTDVQLKLKGALEN